MYKADFFDVWFHRNPLIEKVASKQKQIKTVKSLIENKMVLFCVYSNPKRIVCSGEKEIWSACWSLRRENEKPTIHFLIELAVTCSLDDSDLYQFFSHSIILLQESSAQSIKFPFFFQTALLEDWSPGKGYMYTFFSLLRALQMFVIVRVIGRITIVCVWERVKSSNKTILGFISCDFV